MKVATILGTRPEIIKLCPLLPLLDAHFDHVLVHTGQHYDYEMDARFFEELHLAQPKYNLKVGSGMQGKQTALMLEKIEAILEQEKPDVVIVQGDTNTALAGSLAAVKMKIPIAHVEAGARNFNKNTPEEMNRIVADHASLYLFAVDETCHQNLQQEGISSNVFIVGNTAYDACVRNLPYALTSPILRTLALDEGKYVLVTLHRAETTDDPAILSQVVNALNQLADEIALVFPLHPRTKKALEQHSLALSAKIKIIAPQPYLTFLRLIMGSRFMISDSGGIQDEAIVCNVPCVIPLNETCWPHLVKAGKNFIAGNTTQGILDIARKLLDDEELRRVKEISYPYETGMSQKIIGHLKQHHAQSV